MMPIDYLSLCVACLPLGAYCLAMAAIHASPRPVLIGGAKERVLVGLALLGGAMVGPMRLFLPTNAAVALGWYVWLALIVLYVLGVLLVALLSRPRWVLYGISADAGSSLLFNAARRIDPGAERRVATIWLPQFQLTITTEPHLLGYGLDVVAMERNVNTRVWYALENATRREIQAARATARTRLAAWLLLALAFYSAAGWALIARPKQIATAIAELSP